MKKFILLCLLSLTATTTHAANYHFINFLDNRVAAIAFQYGTTNIWTNQSGATGTNGLGPMTTNGWFWYQNAYVYPTILQGTNYTLVGTPPTGGPIGVSPTYTTNGISITNVNPALVNLFGTNQFFVQWLAGQTNGSGSSVANPMLVAGCKSFADANGQQTSNSVVTISFTCDAATGTNTVYYTFCRTVPEPPWIPDALNPRGGLPPIIDLTDSWVVTAAANGLNQVTVVTNVPPWMLSGNGIVCYSVGSSTNGTSAGKFLGTNIYLQQLSLSGFMP